MRITSTEQLDPYPFRNWCDAQISETLSDEIGGHLGKVGTGTIATRLGIGGRRLYRWRYENKTLDRGDLEDALFVAGVEISDLYPDLVQVSDGPTHGYCPSCKEEVPINERRLCLWCDTKTFYGKPGNALGETAKLADGQVRQLYALHMRGATAAELGRRIWRGAGYGSAESAEQGIRRGFRRLNLPLQIWIEPQHRRCKGRRTWWPNKGAQCKRYAVNGSEYCLQHDPARRDELLELTAKMTEAQELAA